MTKGLQILAALVFCLIILGGVVRITGAGLACPDWPLCHGQMIPPLDPLVLVEWFHRLLAAVVALLTLLAAFVVFRCPHFRRPLGKLMGVAVGLLFVQVLLGAATVWGLLSPALVTLHLAVGYAFFAHCLLMALKSSDTRPSSLVLHPSFWRLCIVTLAIIYIQIILGGLVSSNNAGLVCPDFPTCFGMWIPPLTGLVKFQFLHRLGAVLAVMALLIILWKAGKSGLSPRGRFTSKLAGIFLLIQFSLGVGAIHMGLATPVRIAHVVCAAALFACLIVTTYESRYCT